MRARATTVSLVLGSGGARGLAHIGVIQWLTEQGYEIRSIAGSSIGALVNPLPVAPTLNDATDLTIAVSLNGSPVRREKPATNNAPVQGLAHRSRIHGLVDRLARAPVRRAHTRDVRRRPDVDADDA